MADGGPDGRHVTTAEEWEEAYTQAVVAKIQIIRRRRKMSTAGLAQECESVIGRTVKESAVNALFAGRRKSIAVTEVLMYAAALKCAPIELLAPVGVQQRVEILPNVTVAPDAAVRAIVAESGLWSLKADSDVLKAAFGIRDPGAAKALIESHQVDLVNVLVGNSRMEAGRARPADVDRLRQAFNGLRRVRDELARNGYVLPLLPHGLELVDDPSADPPLPLRGLEYVDLAEASQLGYRRG